MAIDDVSNKSISELISLKGKVAIVTGGAKGIGKATAKRFVEAGASVVIVGRNKEKAEKTAIELSANGATVVAKVMDVADLESVKAVVKETVSELGSLDIMANIAGIFPNDDTLSMSIDQWKKVIDINLTGSYNCAREAVRVMSEAGKGGVIILISSASAYKPVPQYAHYNASKGGIDALTRALAVEFAPQNIRVHSIAPTLVETEGTTTSKADLTAAFGNVGDPWQIIGNGIPLGRIGKADDIARVALFCASELSLFMTGQKFDCDGGDLLT